MFPSIEISRFRKRGDSRPKRLRTDWEDVENRLFRIDSERFVNRIAEVTKDYRKYLKH